MTIETINEKTSLPFKIVIPIVTAIVIGALRVDEKLTAIQNGINESWKATEQQRWIDRLRVQNPAIAVPPIEDIRARDRQAGRKTRTPDPVALIGNPQWAFSHYLFLFAPRKME